MYTSIEDNSTVDATTVKKFLRLDEDDTYLDTVIDLALLAAKQAADNYCQDTFLVGDTVVVPAEIEMWILQTVSLWWERKNPFITSMQYKDLGTVNWEYNYDDYFHGLKAYRREVGFGPFQYI